ncbi:PREDICTED: KDEL motif-containing protein 1-like [Papilio xuthus]|uniref:KDEL motif-containing protein 1-like n=1 Tax=Papilio xuthus TaxID=66420 RepID=A0AAJ6ZAG0_PAPXU|nr:PREDICTED: KDEL motif-containing protein 1-like [Papilio xuthus]
MKYMIWKYFVMIIHLSSAFEVALTGPGLHPRDIVMPARYFIVSFTSFNEETYTPEFGKNFAVEIKGRSVKNNFCRVWVNTLDRKDGSFIVRYKVYETCLDLKVSIYYKSKPINDYPLTLEGPIQADQCDCPQKDLNLWLNNYECPSSYASIIQDLKPFNNQDMQKQVKMIVDKYHKPESTSFCHYVIKNNQIYRDCYGKHIGFNMFSDNILLSLTRKVVLPDMELVINLGDWPLIHKDSEPLPMFSWCGSVDTMDIVMPTYDITESALENMGRVTLDTLSVQGNVEKKWEDRKPMVFWRGRDSRAERLKLIDIARENPELFNVSLTNFFFYREKEAQYGPKQPHVSFFKFFDYKYQINIDGTVAAYRFPYLLSGGGMVLKQESPYYEHFYSQLREWEHYVPVARDLSDLVEKIHWALKNDDKAHNIAKNGRLFAEENLLPHHIICYHALLFSEWSKRISSEVTIREGMTHVPQPKFECNCTLSLEVNREEL